MENQSPATKPPTGRTLPLWIDMRISQSLGFYLEDQSASDKSLIADRQTYNGYRVKVAISVAEKWFRRLNMEVWKAVDDAEPLPGSEIDNIRSQLEVALARIQKQVVDVSWITHRTIGNPAKIKSDVLSLLQPLTTEMNAAYALAQASSRAGSASSTADTEPLGILPANATSGARRDEQFAHDAAKRVRAGVGLAEALRQVAPNDATRLATSIEHGIRETYRLMYHLNGQPL